MGLYRTAVSTMKYDIQGSGILEPATKISGELKAPSSANLQTESLVSMVKAMLITHLRINDDGLDFILYASKNIETLDHVSKNVTALGINRRFKTTVKDYGWSKMMEIRSGLGINAAIDEYNVPLTQLVVWLREVYNEMRLVRSFEVYNTVDGTMLLVRCR